MYLSELKVENYRMFGSGEKALTIPFRPGLTALIGENDSGKTTVIDALRLALRTTDQEFFRVNDEDFNLKDDSKRNTSINIRCKFEGLTTSDKASFLEYLTYETNNSEITSVFYLNWNIFSNERTGGRSYKIVEIKSGKEGEGPNIDGEARSLLQTTYLRPLRDAERALSSGRNSRLAQILVNTKEIKEGKDFNHDSPATNVPNELNVLGISDFTNYLLRENQGIKNARDRLNQDYLNSLSLSGDKLEGNISISGEASDDNIRLRSLLEKLNLTLMDENAGESQLNKGLGSNNLLFMASELLLLGSETEGFPLLLIEEPEAHLHPQRQLRLIQFLQEQVKKKIREDEQNIQILITTHSPNLASRIDLNNLVILHKGKAFNLAEGETKLNGGDYRFLQRFLDVTKANMFFSRGVVIVEGDAENILLPTIAKLIGRDFTEYGVSIVNVGGVGLRRYARIYQRNNPDEKGEMNIPVACITDMDVMPDCAPKIIGKIKEEADIPDKASRKWRIYNDFTSEEMEEYKVKIISKASGQNVKTYISDKWTLEYDLAYSGLDEEVFIAAYLAKRDEAISNKDKTLYDVHMEAKEKYKILKGYFDTEEKEDKEKLASHIYKKILASSVSKPTTAQYLADLLEQNKTQEDKYSKILKDKLPQYIKDAIYYVTND